MAQDPIWVSHTALGDLAQCEQRYFYHYVEKLSPLERAVEPSIGTWIHDYEESYYKGLKAGDGPVDAHLAAHQLAAEHNLPLIEQYKQAAWTVGADTLAQSFDAVPTQADYMVNRYFQLRGQHDADEWEILFVEEPIQLKLVQGNRYVPSIWISAKLDLVARHRSTGRMTLWEHKNPKSIPNAEVRLTDMQTILYTGLLYAKTAAQGDPITIDEIVWNYMVQVAPKTPNLLKSGLDKDGNVKLGLRVSRAKGDLAPDYAPGTTWPVYEAAVRAAGDDPALYVDMYDLLKDREQTHFFNRIQVPIRTDLTYMIGNFIALAVRARDLRKEWAQGKAPIRSLTRSCQYCPYSKLCHTVITKGDVEDTIDQYYKRPTIQQALPIDDAVPAPLVNVA